jgi:adenine deaminase
MVRHSSIRSDLKELCPVIKDLPKDAVMLVSDGIFAADLCTKGYMDHVVGDAIGFGLKPEDAIRMATLNPARYFRMDNDIGSIAPGRIADILLLEDLEHPTPVRVIERGRLVADHGVLKRKEVSFPDIGTRFNPYTFDRVGREEFLIEKKGEGSIPIIDIVDRTVTKKIDYRLTDDGTFLLPDRTGDVRKILCTRRDNKKWGRGFVRGIGASMGAIAATVCHETHGLLVTGFNDDDMELAANTALSIGGGVVFADKGKVLYTLALPYGATMSGLPVKALADELRQANAILQEKGSTLDDPLWTIVFLTFTSIVEVRLTVSGVYDVKKAAIIF